MAEIDSRGRRPRDAARTRAVILDAAEAIFAQHGFDGARFEAIAQASGYNSSLLTRYFGNKLGLYTEVLKRADQKMSAFLARMFAPLLEDGTIVSDVHRFRGFLRIIFGAVFDYMVDHPYLMRMVNWEQAEGGQIIVKIASHFEPDDLARFKTLFSQARAAGLVRPELDVAVMVVLVAQICWSVPAVFPLYQLFLNGGDSSSATALAHLREQIMTLLVAGVTPDPTNEYLGESR
jgi:TetR/AcrR family transcriptional regulator